MSVVPSNVAVGTTVPALTLNAGATGGVAVASSIDPVNDYVLIYTASATATQGINRNTYLGLSSAPVGLTDSQTLQNKTLNNTNAITVKDGSLTLQNSSSTTKQAQFSAANITAGQTRVFTFPDYNATFATLAGIETFTNKTLTSPTINNPTISNATISADTVSGFTTSNNGTIYGMSVTGGVLASAALANAVNTAALQAASVTPAKLATGAQTATVTTNESTISTSYTDLTTPGPAVTVTIGSNGLALLVIGCDQANGTAGGFDYMGWVASGTNTIAAVDSDAYFIKNAASNTETNASFAKLLTGLTPGSTTFTAKYRVNTGTGQFAFRKIAVIPL